MTANALKHKARKRFGQNFLHDPNIIQRIIQSIAVTDKQHIVEIGPGKGALTEYLVQLCAKLDVIELDRDLIPILEQQFEHCNNFQIHNADALQFDFSVLSQNNKLRLVGNLPYNISTPLIFHLLENISIIHDMHFMLQKEVVERLTACPGTKIYGRLSILVQYLCHAEQLFIVHPGAFSPAPKIDSAIIQLTPRTHTASLVNATLDNLSFVARSAFSQRRKTLRNNLKTILTPEQIMQCDIDPARRAETLNIDEFVKLTNQYAKINSDI
ncbi:MAG: 16S rRNA (adenine(1518)-N(6)/adenine(1519)-N(6))-dimethyltransferase RsmA [gamma proteobacterium symbiont of Taylorina sp.]|nr:16S rRNA (adenine(1518)-N(6)/adenine(1519)-N(6))-dimethyltransferase RsmA [gamma proteobacterium symbiont of Taylorina sp.]